MDCCITKSVIWVNLHIFGTDFVDLNDKINDKTAVLLLAKMHNQIIQYVK